MPSLGARPSLRQERRIVEIDRLVEAAAGRIEVDHLEVLADRTRLQLSHGTLNVISLIGAVSSFVARLGSMP